MLIQKTDVIGAIQVYLQKNNRACPANYLIQKFGDDVDEVILSLKKEGKVIGKRGRTGGLVFPDTVFDKKTIEATPVVESNKNTDSDDDFDVEENVPF